MLYAIVAGENAYKPGLRGLADNLADAKAQGNFVLQHEDNHGTMDDADVYIEAWELRGVGSKRGAQLLPTNIRRNKITADWE